MIETSPTSDTATQPGGVLEMIHARVDEVAEELVALRRSLHAHPELSRAEVRTTRLLAARLREAGLTPRLLPGTGLLCDIWPDAAESGSGTMPIVAIRADIDALPVREETDLPYRSTVPGVAHACGHDLHTAVVLGAGLALLAVRDAGALPHPVRLVFQPAEEVMPGGALDVIQEGGLEEVRRILCVHADPRLPTGTVGLRVGPITSASDRVLIRLTGEGGHTARPHLTQDLVYALGVLIAQLPATLARRVDSRAGVNLVWGRVAAGHAANAIPAEGWAEGTVRCLDSSVWDLAPSLVTDLAQQIVLPFGVQAEVDVYRGTPPVVNDAAAIAALRTATLAAVGSDGIAETDQSLGGEDFAWYLESVPGAMARLGVHRVEREHMGDLHQGSFDPDEDAIAIGARVLAVAALQPD